MAINTDHWVLITKIADECQRASELDRRIMQRIRDCRDHDELDEEYRASLATIDELKRLLNGAEDE